MAGPPVADPLPDRQRLPGRQDPAAATRRRRFRRPPRMLTCDECGTATEAGVARWCGHCGNRLEPLANGTERPVPQLERTGVRRLAGPAFIGLLLAALVVPSALQGDEAPARGQSARGDAQRSGVVSETAPAAPREVAWSTEPMPIDLGRTVLSSTRGTAVVGSGSQFEVLDLATGQVLRSVDLQATRIAYGFSTVVGDLLLLPGPDLDELLAADLRTGQTRWRVPLPRTAVATAPDARSIDGDVVATVGTGTIVRFRGDDGAAIWGRDLVADRGEGIQRLVDAGADGVDLVSVRPPGAELRPGSTTAVPTLVRLAASTGEPRWAVELTADEALAPIATSPDWVAHVDLRRGPNPVVVVRSGRTGAEAVSLPFGGELRDLAILDDLVLVSSSAEGLRAFRADSGEERWTVPAGEGALAVAVGDTAQDGRVAVPSEDGLAIVDAGGEVVGRVDVQGETSLSNGVLVVATSGLAVRAYDLAGNQLWRRDLPPPAIASLATDGEIVAVNSPGGTLVVDGRSGERLTSVDRIDSDEARLEVPGSVAVDDGQVFVSPLGAVVAGRGLAALNGRTGISTWSRDGDQPPVFGTITRGAGLLWVSVGDEVHGYEPATGRRTYAALAGMPRGPLVVTSELVVATPAGARCAELESCQDAVVGIRLLDREVAWSSPAPACGPPAARDGRVVVPTSEGPWALGVVDGGLLWRATGAPACGPLALGTAFAHQGSGTTIQSWSLADGSSAWEVDLGQSLATDPVLAGDEVVVATIDGTLYSLDSVTGETNWLFRLPAPAMTDPVVVGDRWVVLLRDGRIVGLR